jgi:hypothetical protein
MSTTTTHKYAVGTFVTLHEKPHDITDAIPNDIAGVVVGHDVDHDYHTGDGIVSLPGYVVLVLRGGTKPDKRHRQLCVSEDEIHYDEYGDCEKCGTPWTVCVTGGDDCCHICTHLADPDSDAFRRFDVPPDHRSDPWATPKAEITFTAPEIRRAEAVRNSMQKTGDLTVADVALVLHYANKPEPTPF